MPTRATFARALATLHQTSAERAIALLWYYRQTQEFDERTASELANDLRGEGFPRPNVTRLHNELRRSRQTIRGKRQNTFQIHVRSLQELNDTYAPLAKLKLSPPSDSILPQEWLPGNRAYLERLFQQINACYDQGFYDASAVLCRRLMESLIIEVYISRGRHEEIQLTGYFLGLDALIRHLLNDTTIPKSQTLRKTAPEVKAIGDSAAHDRTYITRQTDIDSVKLNYGRTIAELLRLSGLST